MVLTKSQFYELKSVKSLPAPEKKKRWKDYQARVSSGYKPPRPSRKSNPPASKPRKNVSHKLSACADNFLRAIADPFGYNGQTMPCIPDSLTQLTQRLRVRVYGSGAIGTAGVGYVTMTETGMAASNIFAGFVTDSAFTGTTIQAGAATGVTGFSTDSPYTTANYTSVTKQFRIVGAGLRVMYTGTELNASGVCLPFIGPNHGDVAGYAVASLSQLRNAVPTSFANRRWHKTARLIANNNDLVFNYTPTANQIEGIIMTGVAGSTFQYEMVGYLEVAGSALPNATPSESDAVGFSAAMSATAKTYLSRAGDWTYNTLKREAVNYLTGMSGVGMSRNSMRTLELLGDG